MSSIKLIISPKTGGAYSHSFIAEETLLRTSRQRTKHYAPPPNSEMKTKMHKRTLCQKKSCLQKQHPGRQLSSRNLAYASFISLL